jgi:hypothetical protein
MHDVLVVASNSFQFGPLLRLELPPLVQRNDSNLEGWVDIVATVESGGPDVVLKYNNGVHDRRLVQS